MIEAFEGNNINREEQKRQLAKSSVSQGRSHVARHHKQQATIHSAQQGPRVPIHLAQQGFNSADNYDHLLYMAALCLNSWPAAQSCYDLAAIFRISILTAQLSSCKLSSRPLCITLQFLPDSVTAECTATLSLTLLI